MIGFGQKYDFLEDYKLLKPYFSEQEIDLKALIVYNIIVWF
jgi:hypothetical protein